MTWNWQEPGRGGLICEGREVRMRQGEGSCRAAAALSWINEVCLGRTAGLSLRKSFREEPICPKDALRRLGRSLRPTCVGRSLASCPSCSSWMNTDWPGENTRPTAARPGSAWRLAPDPDQRAHGEMVVGFDQVRIGQMNAAMGCGLAEGWLVAGAVDVDVAAEAVHVAATVEPLFQPFQPEYPRRDG